MPNFPMLDAIIGYVEAHPEQHNQSRWASQTECGTTACIAGHAILMSGREVVWNDTIFAGQMVKIMSGTNVDGRFVEVFDSAKDILDLTVDQGLELFYCFGDLDDIKGIVKNWANEQG